MTLEELEAGLWGNTRDSLLHAIDHFSEMSRARSDRAHHAKWAILSVHHAAECFCHMKLIAVRAAAGDLAGALFQSNGKTWFPSFRPTMQALGHLSGAEGRLIILFKLLADSRDQIMHRALPEELDPSVAAMSALGILRLLPRWIGRTTADVVKQYPPPQTEVLREISYMRVEQYCKLAEQLLEEEYPDECLPWCPHCETHSVVGRRCEVCFEDMDYIECPNTGEAVYFPSWMHHVGATDISCPHCDETHCERDKSARVGRKPRRGVPPNE